MDLDALMLKRRSCRSYTGTPVPAADVRRVLEAARLAPSACNSQPWHYYAAIEEEKRQIIARATRVTPSINSFTDQAGTLIVVTSEKSPRVMTFVRENLGADYFSDIDIGLSVGFLTLKAAELGIASCIMGVFDEQTIRQSLMIPDCEKLRLVVALGYAADEDRPHHKRRREQEENFHYYE